MAVKIHIVLVLVTIIRYNTAYLACLFCLKVIYKLLWIDMIDTGSLRIIPVYPGFVWLSSPGNIRGNGNFFRG